MKTAIYMIQFNTYPNELFKIKLHIRNFKGAGCAVLSIG